MRELRPELTTLLNSGHCTAFTTLDIVLTDGEDLFVSSGEIHVNRFGKNQQYLARIPPAGMQELNMSLDIEVDGADFQLTNVDMVIGQLLTGAERRLDGAEALVGALFLVNGDLPANAIWDARMPGSLISSQIGDETVDFSLISIIDGISIAGRTIASEFQWQEPISNVPTTNPIDLGPRGPGGGIDPEDPDFPRGRPGRFFDFNNLMM